MEGALFDIHEDAMNDSENEEDENEEEEEELDAQGEGEGDGGDGEGEQDPSGARHYGLCKSCFEASEGQVLQLNMLGPGGKLTHSSLSNHYNTYHRGQQTETQGEPMLLTLEQLEAWAEDNEDKLPNGGKNINIMITKLRNQQAGQASPRAAKAASSGGGHGHGSGSGSKPKAKPPSQSSSSDNDDSESEGEDDDEEPQDQDPSGARHYGLCKACFKASKGQVLQLNMLGPGGGAD